mmetsp:Transcript_118858/g.341324  ORF Transcript_118858/g.341324 Transcript_118858/m.341324 type:complete len:131 (-) Transcript_118858:1289-1681(-)
MQALLTFFAQSCGGQALAQATGKHWPPCAGAGGIRMAPGAQANQPCCYPTFARPTSRLTLPKDRSWYRSRRCRSSSLRGPMAPWGLMIVSGTLGAARHHASATYPAMTLDSGSRAIRVYISENQQISWLL